MKTSAQIENIIKIITCKRNYKSTQMKRVALLSTMLLSLCIFPHHAQAMRDEDSALKTFIKIQLDLFLKGAGLTEEQFKEAHFARNNNQNSDVNYSDISASDSGFRKLPPEKSVFHQIGAGNENNEKWTNDKGEEYVFNPSTNPPKLVTDAVNMGTYNYSPESDPAGHLQLDILPYLLWGNSESDPTTFEERFRLSEEAEITWKGRLEIVKNSGISYVRTSARIGQTAGRTVAQWIKKLKNDGIPPHVVARAKKIQLDMSIENLTGAGSLAPTGNVSLDYKTLDDSELGLDLISDNEQEIIDVQNFRFPIDSVNQQQKEGQNIQSFNDDQRIKTADLAVRQRQEQQRVSNQNKKNDDSGNILSAADSLRLGGNYAYGVAYGKGKNTSLIAALRPYRNQSAPLIKNGGNNSASLFFDGLLEETTSNSPKFSERVKASSEGYGDYNHTAWGAWSGGQNTRLNFNSSGSNQWFELRNIIQDDWRGPWVVQGGHWVYGQRPGIADIPKSGSARYVGQLMGGFWADRRSESSTPEMNSITGDIKMAVTFQDGNNSIFGSLNLKRSGADWASASFNTLNARSAPNEKFRSSDHFSALLNTKGGSGRLTGSFFGANAAEAGGNFYLSKREGADRGSAIGVFRAKNVGNVVGNISDADRLKLLSGNYALATATDPYSTNNIGHRTLYNLPLRNGSSSSLTLRFSGLKESIPNSDPANRNTLIPSDRIKVHARDYGDYSYVAWGTWSSGKNTRVVIRYPKQERVIPGGHWIYGQQTGRADIPRSGSARYTGQVKGSNSITGDINMAVTFQDRNSRFSGVMNLDRNGVDWATARFNFYSPRPSSTIFAGPLRVDGQINYHGSSIHGSFFGTNAAEVGGIFHVSKRLSPVFGSAFDSATGVFRAKKQ